MKKLIISALALSVLASAPALAISASYRAQLERSGCTMETDGKTCDIHKTKAQNQAMQHRASTFATEDILGLPPSEVRTLLKGAGFNEVSPDAWMNGQGKSIAIIWIKGVAADVTVRTAETPPKTNVTPWLGKWALVNEEGQALNDLEIRKNGFLFGGSPITLTGEDIVDGALYIRFGVMNVTLKKNGEGRWFSQESSGTVKHR